MLNPTGTTQDVRRFGISDSTARQYFDGLPRVFRDCLAGFIAKYPNCIIPEISVGFDRSIGINASVRQFAEQYHIVISAGLVLRLAKFLEDIASITRFISHPRLPLSPISVMELDTDNPGDQLLFETQPSVWESRYVSTNNNSPSIRRKISLEMFRIAILFVLFHELAHVLNGHFGFLLQDNPSDSQRLDEKPVKTSDYNRTRHALELDADAFAMTYSFNYMAIASIKANNPFAELCSGEASWAFEVWYGAIFSLFVLLSGPQSTASVLQESDTHPHPLVRLIALAILAEQVPSLLGGRWSACDFRAIYVRVVTGFTHAVRWTIRSETPSLGDKQVDLDLANRYGQIAAEWSRIRPRVAAYCITPTLLGDQVA